MLTNTGAIIEIKNTLGQIVYKSAFKAQISTAALKSGLYFLQIQHSDSTRSFRFTKID
jgi:hypothetical protein